MSKLIYLRHLRKCERDQNMNDWLILLLTIVYTHYVDKPSVHVYNITKYMIINSKPN